jgi:predicted nucleic acid-binding protein
VKGVAAVYFADAFYWIAFAHRRDAWHAQVVGWARAHPNAQLVTTEDVLIEVLNWFAGRGPIGRATGAAAVRRTVANALTQVLPLTTPDFLAALSLYEQRLDKSYSLTDCRSMLAMRALGITEVLSNDRHFAQEGFAILFP